MTRREQAEAHRERARNLRAQGMTLAQIGREMGLTKQRVHQIFEGQTPPRPETHQTIKRTLNGDPMPDDAVFLALYEEGLTDGDVARVLGVHYWQARDLRRRAGVKARQGRPSVLAPCDLERLLEMARNGAIGAELAAEFGINMHYANYLCRKHGLNRSTGIRRRKGAL